MKDTLKQAVKSGDIRQIRAIMIDSMTCCAGNTATLNQITEAIEKVPGLFDRDDGKFYAASARDMTETLIDSLREDLGSNFSLPKYRLYTEVQALRVSDPDYYAEREKEQKESVAYPDGTLTITEEIVGGKVTAASVSETPLPDAGHDTARRRHKRSALCRRIGYCVMTAGVVASIVGLCVPVRFLIGLGIGVIMLGTAIVYLSLRK